MAISCFSASAISASAATVDSESTGVDTLQQRLDKGHQIVKFRFPDTVWGARSALRWTSRTHKLNVYCSYYTIYGNENEVKTRAWHDRSTSLLADTGANDDVFYFDITESGQGELEEGAEYGILFSFGTYQTCDMYFNYSCLNDTYVVNEPEETRIKIVNLDQKDYLGHSLNGIGAPLKKVSGYCTYLDGIDAGNTPKSLEMANALQTFLPNNRTIYNFVWDRIAPVLEQFGTTNKDVYFTYVERFGEKLAEATPYEHVDGVKDLKDDGTLKDEFRYAYIERYDEEKGQNVIDKYPTLDLVRERLNLTEEELVTEPPATEEPTTEAPTEEPATEPVEEKTMIVAGSEAEIFGTVWDGNNEDNLMTANPDGTFTKTYTVEKAYSSVQLKGVLNGADWYGDKTGSNVTFSLTGAGDFTVTATPADDGYVVSVSGSIVRFVFNYHSVYVVGNGYDNWLNGANWDPGYFENEMSQVCDDVWEIVFPEVPETILCEFMFLIDGDWAHYFGGVFEESGKATAAVYNGYDRITFGTGGVSAVKLQLDLRNFDYLTKTGAAFTVTISCYHRMVQTITGYPATCTKTGLTDGEQCAQCHEILKAQEVIPANGHTAVVDKAVAPSCGHTGLTEGSHCSVCGEIIVAQQEVPALDHVYETVPAVPSTYMKGGSTAGTRCKVCGEWLIEPEPVAKKPIDFLIGDINNDGRISIEDATMLQRFLAEFFTLDLNDEKTFLQADVNSDGRVTISDITAIQRLIAEV